MHRILLTSILFLLWFAATGWAAPPRFGAPRALRVVDGAGRVLDGNLVEPAWSPAGDTLYFTRTWGGTSNIWKASPMPGDAARFPSWRAVPVTRFEAPLYATRAQVLPDGLSFVCVTNAVNGPAGPPVPQLAKVDGRTGAFQALTSGPYRAEEAALSPDGTVVAFTSNRSGFESVYVVAVPASGPPADPARRVVLRAKSPSWGPDSTLYFENLRPLSPGLYRAPRLGDPATPPTLLTEVGGPSSYSRASSTLAVAGGSPSGVGQLYVLSSDGSGLRALGGTQQASRPSFSPDASAIAFDAPVADVPRAPRGLWLVQVLRDPPVARLGEVRPASEGAFAIVATITGDGATAQLEIGEGDTPRRFESLPVVVPPVLDAPIAVWKPNRRAGTWTVRLTVTNADKSSAQSLMLVTLPLDAANEPEPLIPTENPVPPAFIPPQIQPPTVEPGPMPLPLPTRPPVVQGTVPAGGGTPPTRPVPLRPAPLPPAAVPPAVIPAPVNSGSSPGVIAGSALPQLPLPALPDPPGNNAVLPLPPRSLPPVSPRQGAPRPPLGGVSRPPATVRTPAPPTSSRTPRAAASRPRVADAGNLNVAGTLASLAPGQVIQVQAWVQNNGKSNFAVRGAGGEAVRLVARWIDFDGGQRRKWAMEWLPRDVGPGETARWSFELKAPNRPGKYRLVYGLLRVRGSAQIPETSAPQQKWPGEFAAIAFAVDVK